MGMTRSTSAWVLASLANSSQKSPVAAGKASLYLLVILVNIWAPSFAEPVTSINCRIWWSFVLSWADKVRKDRDKAVRIKNLTIGWFRYNNVKNRIAVY